MKILRFMTSTGCLLILLVWSKQAESRSNEVNVAAAEIQRESKEPRESAKSTMEQRREEYEKAIEKKLAEFGDRLKALKAEAEKAGGKAKTELRESVRELEKKMAAAKQQFQKFKSASAEAWEGVKSKLDSAMKDLEKYYERVAARSKKSSSETQG